MWQACQIYQRQGRQMAAVRSTVALWLRLNLSGQGESDGGRPCSLTQLNVRLE